MVKKAPGAYWTDEEIKEAIDEWRKKRPEKLKSGDWRVEDVPFYEPGRLPRVELWHRVDYLDVYDLTYGKKWGASGLGKLREVAVIRPTDQDLHVYEEQDPVFMNRPVRANLEKWQKEHDQYVQFLRDNGVTVYYIEYPKPAIGPFGPIRGQWAGCEVKVIWGGALVTKYGGWNPLNQGREKVLTEWLVSQGCPILLTVIGKGVCETGPIQALADDAILIGQGIAYNKDGLEQIRPVLERAGITTIVEVYTVTWPEKADWFTMGAYHPDGFINVLDLGKVLIFPGFCSWQTITWFKDNGFELIEIDVDEQREFVPANLIVLEPGKVMIHAGAKETIKKVRRAGVEVIEVPYKENLCMGGGVWCATLQLVRDRGPKLADMK